MHDWEAAAKYAAGKFRRTYLHPGYPVLSHLTPIWPIHYMGLTYIHRHYCNDYWHEHVIREKVSGEIYIPWVGYVLDDIFPSGLNNLILLLLELEPNDITRPWESRLRATEDITDRWHDVDYTQFWNTNTHVFHFVTRFPFVILHLGFVCAHPGS